MFFGIARDGLRVLAEDARGERIGKNAGVLKDLVSGAVGGRGPSGPAGCSSLHG